MSGALVSCAKWLLKESFTGRVWPAGDTAAGIRLQSAPGEVLFQTHVNPTVQGNKPETISQNSLRIYMCCTQAAPYLRLPHTAFLTPLPSGLQLGCQLLPHHCTPTCTAFPFHTKYNPERKK